jgi:hypothetical protein
LDRDAVAIEDHEGGPVFAGINGLLLVQEFVGWVGFVIVFDYPYVVIPVGWNVGSEFVDIAETEHIRVEEDRRFVSC